MLHYQPVPQPMVTKCEYKRERERAMVCAVTALAWPGFRLVINWCLFIGLELGDRGGGPTQGCKQGDISTEPPSCMFYSTSLGPWIQQPSDNKKASTQTGYLKRYGLAWTEHCRR